MHTTLMMTKREWEGGEEVKMEGEREEVKMEGGEERMLDGGRRGRRLRWREERRGG